VPDTFQRSCAIWCRRCQFDLNGWCALGAEDDAHFVFDIAAVERMAQLAPHLRLGRAEEFHRVVERVWGVVIKFTATKSA
jgi:hypothetical protein